MRQGRPALDRRGLIGAGMLLLTPLARPRPAFAQAEPDAAPRLQREIDAAAKQGQTYVIPPGPTYVSQLRLPENMRIVGASRTSRLVALGSGPLLSGASCFSIAIENLTIDGAGHAPGGDGGLIELRDVAELSMVDCVVKRVAGHGVKLDNCGGAISRTSFAIMGESAVFSTNGNGLSVVDNRIELCGNNAILVWRTENGDDGAVIRGNHISRVRADRGGDGPNGNAINLFRAGGVVCADNIIRGCAFSAIRCNAASDIVIQGNNCGDIGEVALYVEFGFQGAVVSGNVVDGAAVGVSITNFDRGGRLAACDGNVLRNLDRTRPQGHDPDGIGIHVEADTVVSGNAVDRAVTAGLLLGYGTGLRNVLAQSNLLSDCGSGIAVSVAPGAGGARISGNMIARAHHGAIIGMAWDKVVSDDLVAEAARYPQIALSGNDIR